MTIKREQIIDVVKQLCIPNKPQKIINRMGKSTIMVLLTDL